MSERSGRTKAEREHRELQLHFAQQRGGTDTDPTPVNQLNLCQVAFPMRPIGILHSCFGKKNGTPRQPLLVPAARAALTFRPELNGNVFLEGIRQYSHCWVLYIFHENTDLQRLWKKDYVGVKGSIRVPRLNGDRLGVFATRSPHRPCPIGLSVAEVVGIENGQLILGGADIVDGSPVLDIKPYIPFCDAVVTAKTPLWVVPTAEDEPLEISAVQITQEMDVRLRESWEERNTFKKKNNKNGMLLYPRYEEFRELVVQVLSRDIRSVTQRIKVPEREQQQQGGTLPALSSKSATSKISNSTSIEGGVLLLPEDETHEQGKWHVELDGIDVGYEVEEETHVGGRRRVMLKSASCVVDLSVK